MAERMDGMMISTITVAIILLDLRLLASSLEPTIGKRRYFITSTEARAMKILLIRKRYRAPATKVHCQFAIPYPTVQSGGIRAVAIATPESTVPFSFLVFSNIPAVPPKKAISTS